IYNRIARMLPQAQRRAYATTFEATSATAPLMKHQWMNKQLQLIELPGATFPEQQHAFLRFLDALADQVTIQDRRLFLAPDVDPTERLRKLRELLSEHVGAELEEVCLRQLPEGVSDREVKTLAELLLFLSSQGWRPEAGFGLNLCRLWEHLARHTDDP